MRNRTWIVVLAAALGLSALAVLPAGAQEDGERPDRGEMLRLRCEHVRHAGERAHDRAHDRAPDRAAGHGVACGWSASKDPDFAGYRLWRMERAERPEPVFRTHRRDQTRHLDEGVRCGDHVYVVQVVDRSGETIGHSNPARVTCDRPGPAVTLPVARGA